MLKPIKLASLKKQKGVIVSLDIMLGMLITFVVGISLMVVITDALFPWITNAIAYLQEVFLQTAGDGMKNCAPQGNCNHDATPPGLSLQQASQQLPNLQN